MGGDLVSTTSRVPALIDYLVTTFTAAATLGAAAPQVIVYDGPQVTANPSPLALFVGMDDISAGGAAEAATSEQEWAGLGKQARNEIVTVNCVAEAWSGETDVKTLRTAAYAIVAAVEDIVRTDPFSGLALFPDPGVTGHRLLQDNTPEGAVADVAFQVIFKSRIGG